MSGAKVECPICEKLVPEQDINLHLDLQCSLRPGSASGSGSQKVSRTSSQNELVVLSSGSDVDVKPDMPESSKAPMFRKRQSSSNGLVKEEPSASGGARSKRAAGQADKSEQSQKRPRVNPLTAAQPLAERSRPSTMSGYVGQSDIVGPGSLLRARIESGEGVGSCILWGPPGCGKTTLARLMARTANADFKELSATSSGTADVRQVFEQAKNGLLLTGRKTVLLVDEIHRFNRPQQDLFLPYVENGWVQLIGATTENPSFKVNGALLSRCQVFTLSSHTPEDLEVILRNALATVPTPPPLPAALIPFLADVADGDARQALNGLELALKVCDAPVQTTLDEQADPEAARAKRDEQLMEAVRRGLRKGYDRSGEERYDMISALHKSLRGSDGSASMYWLARMLTGGEDPLYIARRLVVVASEDVGLGDSHALPLAMATYQACQVIGMPECRINLAHCVAYLAEAPKSTRAYTAYNRAAALATTPPLPPVPLQVRNAPTRLMKKLGYGSHYSYNPDFAHPVINDYLPRSIANKSSLVAGDSTEAILRTAPGEADDKRWDERRLQEWESRVNHGMEWEGRGERGRPIFGSPEPSGVDDEGQYSRGSEHNPRAGRQEP